MPRPAKPPMTLKEAKRAYKKEAVGFQYTASQMARADRQDAHEEKRKKALEKERQRVENKRKREEKLERERAVKQKMLDEGRITLEDTWGKVTASQPRLNRFFGQKAAVVPAKRKLQEQTVTEAETSSQDERATDNDKRIRETQSAPPSAVKPPTTHILTTISTYSQGVESTLRNQVITRNASQRAFSSAGPDAQKCEDDQGEEVQSQRSRLKYLNPSQINARSKIVQDQQGDKSQSPVRRPLPVVHIASEGLSEPARHSQTGKHDGDISTPASTSHSRSSSSQDHTPTSTTDAIDNEEDFTDGIDDQTLMMLYDEQEQDTSTPTTANASQPPVKDLNVEESAPTSPAKTDECPSPKPRAATSNAIANQHKGTIPPISKGLSESFSSVFNEIDDDDLIALAEKVEANMPSPTSAVTAPISISSTTPAMPDRKATSSPARVKPLSRTSAPPPKSLGRGTSSPRPVTPGTKPSPVPKASVPRPRTTTPAAIPKPLPRASMPPPRPKAAGCRPQPPPPLLRSPQKRTQHSWDAPLKTAPSYDEYGALGPSTQAMMVELVEQVEAKIEVDKRK